RGHLADGPRQLRGVLPGRDGVQVDDAINAVVALLQLDEPLDCAEIVAEVQVTGRLHAGKNQMLERHGLIPGSMIPKSGSRFSDKIMLNRKMPACMPWRFALGKGDQPRSRTAARSTRSRATPRSCSAAA